MGWFENTTSPRGDGPRLYFGRRGGTVWGCMGLAIFLLAWAILRRVLRYGGIVLEKNFIMGFIVSILVGALAGYLAGRLMEGAGFGFLVNMLVGMVGGFLGGNVLGWIGIDWGGTFIGTLVTAVIGSCLLLWIISLIRK